MAEQVFEAIWDDREVVQGLRRILATSGATATQVTNQWKGTKTAFAGLGAGGFFKGGLELTGIYTGIRLVKELASQSSQVRSMWSDIKALAQQYAEWVGSGLDELAGGAVRDEEALAKAMKASADEQEKIAKARGESALRLSDSENLGDSPEAKRARATTQALREYNDQVESFKTLPASVAAELETNEYQVYINRIKKIDEDYYKERFANERKFFDEQEKLWVQQQRAEEDRLRSRQQFFRDQAIAGMGPQAKALAGDIADILDADYLDRDEKSRAIADLRRRNPFHESSTVRRSEIFEGRSGALDRIFRSGAQNDANPIKKPIENVESFTKQILDFLKSNGAPLQ